MNLNFDKTCRLCMQGEARTSIFKEIDGVSLNAMVLSVISVEIEEGDHLPLIICKKCESSVREFFEFKRKCKDVDEKLRAIVQVKEECDIVSEIDDEKCSVDESDGKEALKYENLRPFQCEHCGRTFKLKAILKKHKITHTGEKLHKCPSCPKEYTRSEHLVVHMRSHTGLRPFVCEICARSFTKNQDLSRHKRIHSDEKKFACTRCDRRFKRSADVHSHMRTHTGLRPFVCKTCARSYTSQSGLRKHGRSCKPNQKSETSQRRELASVSSCV